MSTEQVQVKPNLDAIVRPFASLLLYPQGSLPDQDELHALQDYYSAHDHTDFKVSASDEPSELLELPFRLAFGLHPAGPQILKIPEALVTYQEYRHSSGQYYRILLRKEVVGRIIGTTILRAALQPVPPSNRMIEGAVNLSCNYDWITGRQAKLLIRTAGFVRP